MHQIILLRVGKMMVVSVIKAILKLMVVVEFYGFE